jgi:hypothetical protein
MELSYSCEAASYIGTQEFPNNLWNPRAHFSVHKSPPLAPVLNQINTVHMTPSYVFKIHFNTIDPTTS